MDLSLKIAGVKADLDRLERDIAFQKAQIGLVQDALANQDNPYPSLAVVLHPKHAAHVIKARISRHTVLIMAAHDCDWAIVEEDGVDILARLEPRRA